MPPTPSKVLFSPTLRTDPAAGTSSHHLHNNLHEQDEEDEQENIDENQLGGDAPSTPVVGAIAAEESNQQTAATTEDEDDADEFNPYQFIAYLPAHSSVCILDKICLPPLPASSANKKQEMLTLALDLDETLVHCTVEPIPKPDLIFPVK